jgi:mRNA interferase MazF
MKASNMVFGDVLVLNFPFTNLSGFKKRPSVCLQQQGQDVLVVFLSSVLGKERTADFVVEKDAENNLVQDSLVRAFKLSTVHEQLVHKKIGSLKKGDRLKLKRRLRNFVEGL